MNAYRRRHALWLVPILALSTLSACAGRPGWVLGIDRVGPTYVPALNVKGVVQRVAALNITGSPELITPLMLQAETEGWKATLLHAGALQIDPVGHSLDEVTALSFRLNNGEFGDLKFNIVMRPDKKAS